MVRATVQSQMHGTEEHQIGLNALDIDCFGSRIDNFGFTLVFFFISSLVEHFKNSLVVGGRASSHIFGKSSITVVYCTIIIRPLIRIGVSGLWLHRILSRRRSDNDVYSSA